MSFVLGMIVGAVIWHFAGPWITKTVTGTDV